MDTHAHHCLHVSLSPLVKPQSSQCDRYHHENSLPTGGEYEFYLLGYSQVAVDQQGQDDDITHLREELRVLLTELSTTKVTLKDI